MQLKQRTQLHCLYNDRIMMTWPHFYVTVATNRCIDTNWCTIPLYSLTYSLYKWASSCSVKPLYSMQHHIFNTVYKIGSFWHSFVHQQNYMIYLPFGRGNKICGMTSNSQIWLCFRKWEASLVLKLRSAVCGSSLRSV